MKNYLYLLPAVFFTLLSCKSTKTDSYNSHQNISIEWNDKTPGLVSSITEDIKYIPIETHPDGLFSGNSPLKIIFKNDRILIFDKRRANALLMFDMDGRFLQKIGKRGSGPGEYNVLSSYTADDNYIYLLDASKSMVLTYDYKGNYIKALKTPNRPMDIAVFNNGDFLLTNHPLIYGEEKGARLFITDDKLNIKNELFPVNETDSKLTMSPHFADMGDKFSYQNYIQDTLVVFDKRTEEYETYSFDFPHKVPLEMRSELDFKNGNYQYLSYIPALVTGKYVVCTVSMKPFIIDTQTGAVYKNDKNSLYGNGNTIYNDHIVFAFTGGHYRYVVENGNWPRAPKEMDEFFMSDDDNVGLILYKLK